LVTMKLLSSKGAAIVALTSTLNVAHAFMQPHLRRISTRRSSPSSLNVNLPRLDLPGVVTDKLEQYDLINPNTMDEDEYKGYSGAAIAGTLLFFLLPGLFLTGIPDTIGDIAGAAIPDFAFSAITGGGLAIYLSLRDDEIGETVRDYGSQLITSVGLPTLRYNLPEQVTDVMQEKLSLINPNEMSEEDYNGYSGAAVAGTLAFFLLPGAAITGELSSIGDLLSSLVKDFLFSAIIGGGPAIYLSLRNDDVGETAKIAGSKVLDTIDSLIEGSSKLLSADDSLPATSADDNDEE